FIHLCLAWSLLLASYWLLAEIYDPGTSESIWALTNSIVYSIVSILVVWLLSEAEQRFRVAPVIVEGFVWAISLLLGYSWKLVFTEAQNAVMDTDRWGLRILTSVMNFGLMVPVYFRYILPKMDPPSPVQILSAVGYPKYRKVMESGEGLSELTKTGGGSGKIGTSSAGSKVAVVGSRLETSARGLLDIQYPISRGSVTDWDGMEHIWRHVFSEGLKCRSQEHPVLISEPPLNPMVHREKLAECLFEVFKVPAIHIASSPVLSLYASGRTTGVVLDIGDGVSQVMPVYDGYAVGHAATRGETAGRNVTEWLQLSLKRQCGINLLSTADREIVRTMKEDCCAVSLHPAVQGVWRGGTEWEFDKDPRRAGAKQALDHTYELPDGSIINIGLERYQAPEILFNPTMGASADQGVHLLLDEAIQKSDMDLRRTLLQNVVLAGGSTLFPGFGERLLGEMRKLVPKDARIKICAPPERKLSAWVGGSVVSSLSSFKRVWLTREEYKDGGLSALHRRTG
ncbi:Alpha-centractin, partial [Perkinsus olseni]